MFKLPDPNYEIYQAALTNGCRQELQDYGTACAKAALKEVASRMRKSADQNVAKWEEVGDDEDVIHAKSAAFSVYVHAASIMKFAEEIT